MYSGDLAHILVLSLIFVIPCIVLILIQTFLPNLKNKRSTAFYIGWIPLNLISCIYFGYSVNVLDGIILFVFCQCLQLFVVLVLSKILYNLLGE